MATKPTIFMGGFSVEFLNGDESFLVHVYYRDEKGIPTPESDKFSFTTAAKLKKFIKKSRSFFQRYGFSQPGLQHAEIKTKRDR